MYARSIGSMRSHDTSIAWPTRPTPLGPTQAKQLSDHLGIAELLRLDVGPSHKAGFVLLRLLYPFDICFHLGLELPLGGFDRALGSGTTFGGIACMLDQLARCDLMILPLLGQHGQPRLGQLRRLKTLRLHVKQLFLVSSSPSKAPECDRVFSQRTTRQKTTGL